MKWLWLPEGEKGSGLHYKLQDKLGVRPCAEPLALLVWFALVHSYLHLTPLISEHNSLAFLLHSFVTLYSRGRMRLLTKRKTRSSEAPGVSCRIWPFQQCFGQWWRCLFFFTASFQLGA